MTGTSLIVLEMRSRLSRMRLREWEDALPSLVEEFRVRDDLVEILEEADENTQLDARIRVVCRRAFKARHGVSIHRRETLNHHLYGRF